MNNQPYYPPTRPNLTSIAAAGILSGGLITAAIIDSHKPSFSSNLITSTDSRERVPPFSKESVREQLRTQFLASPQLQGVKPLDGGSGFLSSAISKGSRYNLTEATATEVQYDVKEDDFAVSFDLTWKSDSGTTAHTSSNVFLHNDGYHQYFGTYLLPGAESPLSSNAPEVKVDIK